MEFIKTDGGKSSSGFTHETNDCAVRAHALFTQTPYEESHAIFKKLGRRDGRGTKNQAISLVLNQNYHKVLDRMTLNQLRNAYPKGRVYALKRGHAFTLIDGVLHDTWKVGDKSRVFCFWLDDEAKSCADQPKAAPVIKERTERNVAPISDKKEQARTIFNQLNDGTRTKYAIAKLIAEQMGITVANANYYVTRCGF